MNKDKFIIWISDLGKPPTGGFKIKLATNPKAKSISNDIVCSDCFKKKLRNYFKLKIGTIICQTCFKKRIMEE